MMDLGLVAVVASEGWQERRAGEGITAGAGAGALGAMLLNWRLFIRKHGGMHSSVNTTTQASIDIQYTGYSSSIRVIFQYFPTSQMNSNNNKVCEFYPRHMCPVITGITVATFRAGGFELSFRNGAMTPQNHSKWREAERHRQTLS